MRFLFFFITLLFEPSIIEQLNQLPRENIFCNDDNKIDLWNIDCAIPLEIEFTNYKQIESKQNTYLIKGLVMVKNDKEPLENVKINYYDTNNNSCKLISTTKSNKKGEFELEAYLSKDKMITFSYVGFQTTSIVLNL